MMFAALIGVKSANSRTPQSVEYIETRKKPVYHQIEQPKYLRSAEYDKKKHHKQGASYISRVDAIEVSNHNQAKLIKILENSSKEKKESLIVGLGWCASYKRGKLQFAYDPTIRDFAKCEYGDVKYAVERASKNSTEIRNKKSVVKNLIIAKLKMIAKEELENPHELI